MLRLRFLYKNEKSKVYESISIIVPLIAFCSTPCKLTDEITSSYSTSISSISPDHYRELSLMCTSILRESYSCINRDLKNFSNLEILNILEGLVKSFGYIHQSIYRILLDFSSSRPSRTKFDMLILFKLYQVSFEIQNKLFHNGKTHNIIDSYKLNLKFCNSIQYGKIMNRIKHKIGVSTPKFEGHVCKFDSTKG